MDSVMARAYRDRWLAVAAVERAASEASTITDRWAELNAILMLASELGFDLVIQRDDEEKVWLRWSRLKAYAS